MRETFTEACSDRRRCNSLKLKEGRFRSDKRKKSFATRVGRNRSRLPEEALHVLSLEVTKAGLDTAWSNLA